MEEQRAIMREFGEELSYEALTKMEVLHAIITEALRMHPPLVMLLRYARQAMSVTTRDGKQYVIPKVCAALMQPVLTMCTVSGPHGGDVAFVCASLGPRLQKPRRV